MASLGIDPPWMDEAVSRFVPDNVIAKYVSVKPQQDQGWTGRNRGHLLVLTSTHLLLIGVEADFGKEQREVRVAVHSVSRGLVHVSLTGIHGSAAGLTTGSAKVTVEFDGDAQFNGWGSPVTLPIESTDYGSTVAGEDAALQFGFAALGAA